MSSCSSSPFCVLHDLIIEYLQQSTDCQQIHNNLIDGYRKHCNGKWSTYTDKDYYYYQYLIQHAIQAKDDETIQAIMKDFKWMNVKLQLDRTIYHLCTDIERAIDYFQSKDIEVDCVGIDQLLKFNIIYQSVYSQRYRLTYIDMI